MIVSELLKNLEDTLSRSEIEEPRLEAELLIRGSLAFSKTDLLINTNKTISESELLDIQSRLQKRLSGIPSAYILGKKEFFGRDFIVNENVLIPRPETEIMIEDAISIFKHKECRILDLCTGSGCIAITLALELPNAHIVASDISDKALEIAQFNAHYYNTNIEFIQSDLFENIPGSFDAILTNPPYVPTIDIPDSHEPHLALDGGNDGLDTIRLILTKLPTKLYTDGICWMEMAINHYPLVKNLANSNYSWKSIESVKDLANIDRFAKFIK